ncbi:MAG: helicase-related protein [bacterium]|nr:helicase-related protein [bacterium]
MEKKVRDIIVTTPKNKIETAGEEAEGINGDGHYFRTFTSFPDITFGSRIYYVEDGFVRGFGVVSGIKMGNMICGTTGKKYSGSHAIIPANSWKWISPIRMNGFQGWRYFDSKKIKVVGGWRDPKPVTPGVQKCRLEPGRIHLKSSKNQIDNLLEKLHWQSQSNNQTIVAARNKRLSEDIANYLGDFGYDVRYLHSDIRKREQRQIVRQFNAQKFSVLVVAYPLNIIPLSSMVCILDADAPSYTRTAEALGALASHASGGVILYADKRTPAMKAVFEL